MEIFAICTALAVGGLETGKLDGDAELIFLSVANDVLVKMEPHSVLLEFSPTIRGWTGERHVQGATIKTVLVSAGQSTFYLTVMIDEGTELSAIGTFVCER